jgi:hypothetical protein
MISSQIEFLNIEIDTASHPDLLDSHAPILRDSDDSDDDTE